MIIGCDIGGVVKEMTSDKSIDNAIESIHYLEKLGFEIIFISKCKKSFSEILSEWLMANKLLNKVYFCEEYSEKCGLCKKLNVNYMIDDKLQVFREIPDNIKKIWFCDDIKKINGALKFQNDEASKVHICKDWNDIVKTISNSM